MRQANVRLGRAPEYNKRADPHLLVIGLSHQHSLLLHAQNALVRRGPVLVLRYALVNATVRHRRVTQKKRAVRADREATAGHQLIVPAPVDLWPRCAEGDAAYGGRLALHHSRLVRRRLLDLRGLGQHIQVEVLPDIAMLVGDVARENAGVRSDHILNLEIS